VWTTCRDFLSLCAGDSEEHALTLCNYFLHSGWPAYVALGVGLHDPQAACVVTLQGEGDAGDAHDVTRVWNASTGRVYAAEDASCELREVRGFD
jgi:coiled-coil and C2 domain-containing protein 2A